MSKLITVSSLGILFLLLVAPESQAGHRCQCGATYYVAPAAAASVQAAQIQPEATQGYRAMSYQPAPAPAPVYVAPSSRSGGQDLWRFQKSDPRKYVP